VHGRSRCHRRPGQRADDGPCMAAPGATARTKSRHAAERDAARVQQARAVYRQRLTALDLRRGQFVDESGVHPARTRVYGRAPAGERVIGRGPQHGGQNVTMLGAPGVHGLRAVMTVDGAPDTGFP
jgi:hypothetical protein